MVGVLQSLNSVTNIS